MTKNRYFGTAAILAAILFSHVIDVEADSAYASIDENRDVFFQISTIDALLQAIYDSNYSYESLKEHGDFGIGTFGALDGEMVALDGSYYQIRSDGKAYLVSDNMTTPFASVTYFNEDLVVPIIHASNTTDFIKQLDTYLPSRNVFYAIRIDGTFPYLKARSVPKQIHPYPLLVNAIKNQTIFEFHNISGTIIGFWAPEFSKSINVPGYHLHFITSDRKAGGHIIDFQLENADARIDITPDFFLTLPRSGDFYNANLTQDLQSDLKKVEK